LIPIRNCPTKLKKTGTIGVAVVGRLGGCFYELFNYLRGGRDIRVPDTEVDQVGASGQGLPLSTVNLGEEVGRQLLDSSCLLNV